MKQLKLLLLSVGVLFMLGLYSCEKDSLVTDQELSVTDLNAQPYNQMKTPSIQPIEVTVPFKVDYVGEYGPFGARCPGQVNVIVDGEGTGTHVGRSTIHFDFCGTPQPDGSFIYGDPDATAYIIAANGDSLFVSASGTVVPGRMDDHPEYVTSHWRDPFEILGGTGRFEGATGEGMTDDYNSALDPYSHHHWEGTITMIKGNRK